MITQRLLTPQTSCLCSFMTSHHLLGPTCTLKIVRNSFCFIHRLHPSLSFILAQIPSPHSNILHGYLGWRMCMTIFIDGVLKVKNRLSYTLQIENRSHKPHPKLSGFILLTVLPLFAWLLCILFTYILYLHFLSHCSCIQAYINACKNPPQRLIGPAMLPQFLQCYQQGGVLQIGRQHGFCLRQRTHK